MAEKSARDEQNLQGTTAPGRTSKPNRRLRILLGLFGLMLFASGWDFLIARPGVEQAYAIVEEANTTLNDSTQRVALKNMDVQRLLGRAPSETFQKDEHTIEVFAWQAGMPLEINGPEDRSPGIGRKTHDYYAVYQQRGSDLLFQTHYKFKLDSLALYMPLAVDTGEGADTEADSDEEESPTPTDAEKASKQGEG